MTAGEMITNAQREIDRLQEENRQLRADLADERARAVALAEAHVALKAEHERAIAGRTEHVASLVRLQDEIRHLRADLADAKGAAAGAREDAERLRAERDALRVERCARDAELAEARGLMRILLWAASVAIERDELRAEADR